jgi:hypothetical protein
MYNEATDCCVVLLIVNVGREHTFFLMLRLMFNSLLRWTAYRQFTLWIHGRLGRFSRIPVPACVVHTIWTTFPDEHGVYEGFHEVLL